VIAENVVQILSIHKKDFAMLAYGQTLDIFKGNIASYKSLDQVKRLITKDDEKKAGK
jgi:hypothetical protein